MTAQSYRRIPRRKVIRAFYGGSPHTRLPAEPLIILLAFYGATHTMNKYRNRRARVDTSASP